MVKKCRKRIAMSIVLGVIFTLSIIFAKDNIGDSVDVMAATGAGVQYQTHVQTYGWQGYVSNGAQSGTTGQGKRLEGIRIKLSNADYSGSIQYRTHVQSYGWMDWVSNGNMSGTTGKAKRLEAIQIKLTGEMANKYDIYYRVHSQKFGWLDWAKNGESAGTAGYGYRLESIQIKLVPKGGKAPGSTSNPYRETLVKYRTHVQSYGWQSYVSDGTLSGTTGKAKRLEAVQISLVNPQYSGSIQYRTHVQSYGWMSWSSNGAMNGTSGQAKRLEAIQIKLTGEMANKYDVYYRAYAQTYGWLGWAKNGASAGTSGYGKRLEAIQVKLVPKGSAAPGSTSNAYKEKPVQTTVSVTGISLNKTSYTMAKGSTYTLSATVTPTNATNKNVTWTSSDKTVATVSSTGKVTALKTGTTTITAKSSNGKTAVCKITVKTASQPVQGEDSDQGDEEALYKELFDINNKVTFDMDISDEQIKLMQQDYENDRDIYRKIDKLTITIGNKKYYMYEVGVRIKGNTSRVDLYNNGNVDDRNLVHLKITFKETFDDETEYDDPKVWASDADRKARKKRTFATLKTMEFKWNRNADSTYIANHYATEMFRAMGVTAQNTSLANIRFGGYNYGVYTMYEVVDEIFISRYFSDDSGDLYKCAWGQKNSGTGSWSGATYKKDTITSMNVEEDGKNYIYELKTNKKSSTQEDLKNLINTFAKGTPTKAAYASVVDADKFVKYAAAYWFIGNPDDMRNNYNNHYVYFLNGKAVFIPYDNDRCLNVGSLGKDMYNFSPYAEDTAMAGSQDNPVYKYSVITRNNLYTQEYTQALKNIAESGWFDYSNYKKMYETAKANYSSVAIPDSNVKAYNKDIGGCYNSADLAFAESNSRNKSVKDYMTNIMKAYNNAMAKWDN